MGEKIGAKSRYFSHVQPRLLEIAAWCRDGVLDKSIAKCLGVSVASFYGYKKAHEEFAEILKTSKAVADIQVENALFKRATGYAYEEESTETSEKGTTVKITKKHVVPDTTAQIFWLKNRKPREWRDKQDIEHSGKFEFVITGEDEP